MPPQSGVERLVRTTWSAVRDLGLPTGGGKAALEACERLLEVDRYVPASLRPYVGPPRADPAPPLRDSDLATACHPKLTSYATYQREIRRLHRALGDEIVRARRGLRQLDARIRKLTHPGALRERILGRAAPPDPPSAATARQLEVLERQRAQACENLEPLEAMGRVLTYLRGRRALDGLEIVPHASKALPVAEGAMIDGYEGLQGVLMVIGSLRLGIRGRDEASGRREPWPALSGMAIAGGGWTPADWLPVGPNVIVCPMFNLKPEGPGGGVACEIGFYIRRVGGFSFYSAADDLDGLTWGLTIYADPHGRLGGLGAAFAALYRRPESQRGARGFDVGWAPPHKLGGGLMVGHPGWTGLDPLLDALGRALLRVARRAQRRGAISQATLQKLEREWSGRSAREGAPSLEANASERFRLGRPPRSGS